MGCVFLTALLLCAPMGAYAKVVVELKKEIDTSYTRDDGVTKISISEEKVLVKKKRV